MTASTIGSVVSSAEVSSAMNVRSILSASSGRCLRYDSDE
jgi:hypothetical protein